ncbi:LysR family transcriptional regulator [Roseomonas sp. BN140053]|uniref:LysR family transcriptional regulator n=1 Tax=Roseomonas sp. BN140053 TaxID=3391898 RepID=UPI0039EA1599
MDTKLLETFVAVVQAGSLSAAASQLGVAQPLVSRRLQELEALCGAPLLYRHGRGVHMTPAGAILHEEAPKLLTRCSTMLTLVAAAGATAEGPVSIGVSPSIVSAAGVRITELIAQNYPGITLQMVAGYSRHLHEWLLQGRIDIGLLSDTGLSNQLASEHLGAARVVLAGRPGFIPVGCGALPFSALAGIPLIVPTEGMGLRRYITLAAQQAGVRLTIAHEVDDITLAKDLVAAEKGATLISELAVAKEIARGELVCRSLSNPELHARAVLATALNRPVTPAMKAVIVTLKSVCAAVLPIPR